MKFRVLRDSYLFRTFYKPGEIVDFPDDKLPRDISGNVMFNKMSALEPLQPPAAPVAAVVPASEPETDDVVVTDEALLAEIEKLDPDQNEHWTLGGLPSLEYLCGVFGQKISRKDVQRVKPDFTRDGK
jgi:hypothetical protein